MLRVSLPRDKIVHMLPGGPIAVPVQPLAML
jgi:hypothetical protein